MSDQKPSGQNVEAGGEDKSKDTVSFDSYSKLLGEKKKLQADHAEMKAKFDEIEQAKLEADGKIKEALDNQKKLTEQFKQKNLEIVKSVSNKAVRSQFLREAEKLGCIDSDLAMTACSFDDLEITDDFEFDSQKLVSKIQELTKTKPHLFKKDVKLPADLNPSNQVAATKQLSQMNQQELKNLLAMKLAKT